MRFQLSFLLITGKFDFFAEQKEVGSDFSRPLINGNRIASIIVLLGGFQAVAVIQKRCPVFPAIVLENDPDIARIAVSADLCDRIPSQREISHHVVNIRSVKIFSLAAKYVQRITLDRNHIWSGLPVVVEAACLYGRQKIGIAIVQVHSTCDPITGA